MRLIAEAQRLNHLGKMLAPIIDDAHLMDIDSLRKLRLLFEDFPKNHNLVLVAQPELLQKISLTTNEDIKSRLTYSVVVHKLAPDDMTCFILAELDRIALAHATFTQDALSLIVRASEGILRRAKNLCVAALLEAVRDRTKTVDLKQVNRVLLQPHWRGDLDVPAWNITPADHPCRRRRLRARDIGTGPGRRTRRVRYDARGKSRPDRVRRCGARSTMATRKSRRFRTMPIRPRCTTAIRPLTGPHARDLRAGASVSRRLHAALADVIARCARGLQPVVPPTGLT